MCTRRKLRVWKGGRMRRGRLGEGIGGSILGRGSELYRHVHGLRDGGVWEVELDVALEMLMLTTCAQVSTGVCGFLRRSVGGEEI